MTDIDTFSARIAQRRPEFTARVLEAQLSSTGAELLAQLPDPVAAAVLGSMTPREATQRLRLLDPEALTRLLALLSPTTAASLLRPLETAEIDTLLAATPTHVAKPVRYLLRYPTTVVGAWMQANALVLPQDVDVAAARDLIRSSAEQLDRQLLLVDRQQRLVGSITAAALLREDPTRPLSSLMGSAPLALHSRTTIQAASEHPGWESCDPLPVINRERRVIGLIHHAHLRQALRARGQTSGGTSSSPLLELMDLSWQGLADLLEGSLKFSVARPASARTDKRDV